MGIPQVFNISLPGGAVFVIFELMELSAKLRLNTAVPLWVIEAPHDVRDILPGIDIAHRPGEKGDVAQLMLFARHSGDLARQLPLLAPYIGHNTLFWICYPKQAGAIQSDLTGMAAWEVVFQAGYRGQTSVSVNKDWTGMRFTNAPRKKPSLAELPPEERKVEGIDFVARTAVLPADALEVLSSCAGLIETFNAMAFTHKKEYIMAIAEAKKPETRANRIARMAAMLEKIMAEKELKKQKKTGRV